VSAALLELFDSALDLLTGSQLAGLLTPPGPPAASPPAPTPAGPLLAAVNASEVRDALAAAVDSLVALPDDIDGLEDGITDAVQLLRDSFNDTLADIRSRFEAPTLAVEQRWRFIPIAGGGCRSIKPGACPCTFHALARLQLWLAHPLPTQMRAHTLPTRHPRLPLPSSRVWHHHPGGPGLRRLLLEPTLVSLGRRRPGAALAGPRPAVAAGSG
jgi:hypothetical protein